MILIMFFYDESHFLPSIIEIHLFFLFYESFFAVK